MRAKVTNLIQFKNCNMITQGKDKDQRFSLSLFNKMSTVVKPFLTAFQINRMKS